MSCCLCTHDACGNVKSDEEYHEISYYLCKDHLFRFASSNKTIELFIEENK